jgi:hypothetical protein
MQTTPRPFAFVLMPFSKEFDDAYELAILPACSSAGAYAERVDKQIFLGSILERVYNQIAKADLIIADMTGRNANVFYEVGYAHALGKAVVLLTRNAEDIPFDLKHYPHIVYEGSLATLKRELEARVRWQIEHPVEQKSASSALHIRVNGVSIADHPTIQTPIAPDSFGFRLRVEVQNRTYDSISSPTFQIGLIAPSSFSQATVDDHSQITQIDQEDERRLFLCGRPFALFPEAWDTITFSPVGPSAIPLPVAHEFTIRVYRDSGVQDFSFALALSAR